MADTRESLAAEALRLRKVDDESSSKLVSALQAAVEAQREAIETYVVEQQALASDTAKLAARIEALPSSPPTPPAWVPQFPGDVQPGTIRWGCSIEGNGDPVARHETIAGVALGLRRTFWDMGKVDKLVATAAADIAAGRVPWVSGSPPTTSLRTTSRGPPRRRSAGPPRGVRRRPGSDGCSTSPARPTWPSPRS